MKYSIVGSVLLSAIILGGCTFGNGLSDKKSENQASDNSIIEPTENNELPHITEQLQIATDKVKHPTDFPVEGHVQAIIQENSASKYSLQYKTGDKLDIASFSGTLYNSPDEAKARLAEFMEGKTVPNVKEAQIDIGHGIMGYGEGAAGHAYFSWEEGRWTLAISSMTEDEMNNPEIARKMVDYLEQYALPAPKEQGIVYVHYPYGGTSVEVDIRWQENEMLYELTTELVPLDALRMAVSVE